MAWVELHITTIADHTDALGDELLNLGASALTLKDAGDKPIYEPAPGETPVWHQTTLIGLFTDEDDLNPVLAYVEAQKELGHLQDFALHDLPDQPWERTCLQDFKPVKYGKRLWICPSWETPPEENSVNVILDPGLAFGTGSSPTTALCLEWLDANIKPGDTVIDYGCGSGILALAALKLGAAKVYAVDYDPQALLATKENAIRNQIDEQTLEVSSPSEFTPRKVDVVAANILAKSLIELAEFLADLVKSRGKIVLSGILSEQAEDVLQVYSHWFNMAPSSEKDGWVRLSGIRK